MQDCDKCRVVYGKLIKSVVAIKFSLSPMFRYYCEEHRPEITPDVSEVWERDSRDGFSLVERY